MEEQSDSDPLSILQFLENILTSPLLVYFTESLLILALLFLTGFLSSLELAFNSLSSDNLNPIKNSKVPSERRLNYIHLNIKQALVALRLSKNITTVCLVSLATFFIWSNRPYQEYPGAVEFITILIITLATIFSNEVFSKILIRENNFAFARRNSLLLFVILNIFKPFNRMLGRINQPRTKKARRISSASNESPNDYLEDENNSDEDAEGHLEEETLSTEGFDSTTVKQIMVNRLDIMAFDYNLSFEDLLKEVNLHGFSRIPVYKESIDSVEGILYVKDLLIHIEKKAEFDWHKLIRPGFFVPESKKIEDLLKDFQEKKVHMAIVVDEYGGTSGLVTLEDILEEIVGEINDEFDNNPELSYSKLDESTFIFEGSAHLGEFAEVYNIKPNALDTESDNESLSDFLIKLFERVPSIGEQITYNQFEFTIIGVDKDKITRVKVFIKDQTNKEGQLVGR